MELTPNACIEARKLLGWSRLEVQRRTKLAYSTIENFESGEAASRPETALRLRLAFEAAGLAFPADGLEGPAVRLRHAQYDPS